MSMRTEEDTNYMHFEQEMLELFYEQGHYRMCSEDITKENMLDFIAEFGNALIHMQVNGVSYSDTGIENINEELVKIKLKDILSTALGIYQRYYLEEHILRTSCKDIFIKLKCSLVNVLFDNYSSVVSPLGKYEEFKEMELEDIFLLLDDIINII